MGKPTFSVVFLGNGIAPSEVQFTSTPQAPDEEIYLFDFKDGILYGCSEGERVVRHTFRKPGLYSVTAVAVDRKTTSDPVTVVIKSPNPSPDPVDEDTSWIGYLRGVWRWIWSHFK